MVDIVIGIIIESRMLLIEMAPYLLFGFFFAGILHMFLRPETIACHLGQNSFASVLKASLFGIPLPLCSCGVIPAALSLRKEGASKGAVLSFLISTPTSGIDSIFATFALLGGVFAAYRVFASFIAALFVGVLANFILPDKERETDEAKNSCRLCDEDAEHYHPLGERIKGIFSYAFGTLLDDSGKWLLLGIFLGGIIAYFLPEEFIHRYLGRGWQAIVVMFMVGIPMYVCASGSIPIAAALMLKGLTPGAAFAFLMAGPATNTVTMTVVLRNLGKGALSLYLTAIIVCSLCLGLLLDGLFDILGGFSLEALRHHRMLIPHWLEVSSAILLLFLIGCNVIRKSRKT